MIYGSLTRRKRVTRTKEEWMKYICLGYLEPGKFEGMKETRETECSTNVLSTTTIWAPTDILLSK